DSVTTLQLTVNPVYDEYRHERIYEDEFYTVGNYKYNTPGLHISNLQTVEGCDSIINLYLDIIYYPPELTAFTPLNKDGVNDYFMPGFKVQILNRNGTLIYETKTVEEQALGWDGRNAKGQNVEPGLYFYILYNSSGKPRIKSSVEVLKK
ncbi:MAG: gliding motility-associated C-terminal domain-containing protein, partial [Prevotellaceae bacterium]|nr:gliding motility-associated C-terminal domain-containing protein [Prevotellaceae bacterium]